MRKLLNAKLSKKAINQSPENNKIRERKKTFPKNIFFSNFSVNVIKKQELLLKQKKKKFIFSLSLLTD